MSRVSCQSANGSAGHRSSLTTPRYPLTVGHSSSPVTTSSDRWCDAAGRATFERIVATERDRQPRPHVVRRRLLIGTSVAIAASTTAALIGIPGLSHEGTAPAWSVTRNPDGTVTVKFNDYRDPTGLQTRLRAAGARANVETLTRSCYPSSAAPYLQPRPNPRPPGRELSQLAVSSDGSISQAALERLLGLQRSLPPTDRGALPGLEIDPRYLPPGDSIWIGLPPPGTAAANRYLAIAVHATTVGRPRCFSS